MTTGRVIVLAGMDGAGKTLQARRLVRALRDAGVPARYLWCRGRNWLSLPFVVLGRRLHGAPKSHQHLFADADRKREAGHQQKKGHLLQNRAVRWGWVFIVLTERVLELSLRTHAACLRAPAIIVDRYLYDSLVDLAVDLGESPRFATRRLRRWYTRLLPRPSQVFLLDLDPRTAFSRKPDIPSEEYLRRRRAHYLALACAGRWTVLDASQTPDHVFRRLWNTLTRELHPSR